MNLCSDWIEMLRALNAGRVRYLVIGGHAYSLHVEPRFTGDLDLWVDPDPANAERLWRALLQFGAPLGGITLGDFTKPTTVFQMGTEPNRIDVLTGIEAVSFSEAWRARVRATLGGVPVFLLSERHLIRNKLAAGRPKDLIDVEKLEAFARYRKKKTRRRKR